MSGTDEKVPYVGIVIFGIVALILWGMVDDRNEQISQLKANSAALAKESLQQEHELARLQTSLDKVPDREDRAWKEGYRSGQVYICNTLYGGTRLSDGWSLDLGSQDGYPLHRAIVLVWFANAPNEVPYRITKAMCLQGARH